MKYYLVSPRVDGESPIDGFLKTMFARHIVMMGWGTDNRIGADFHDIRKGDFVLVAQRINWKFKYFFAGIVADSKTYEEDGFQYKKLIHFVDLRNNKMDFLADASFAEMRVVKAMMAINKYNNSECVKHFDAIIQQQKHIEIMNNYISLLKTNHNLILTGAPGTGKTYLAKEIAKEMGCPEDEIGFVQFHPSYDYTDFVEGLRPVTDRNGNVGFERKDGVFKEFCKRILDNVSSCTPSFNAAISSPSDRMLITYPDDTSFEKVYKSIEEDVKQRNIKTLQVGKNTMSVAFIYERLRYGNKNKPLNEKNLRLMYEYFLQQKIFDLSSYGRDDYWDVITKLTQGYTKTIDYVYYAGMLQEMLNRARIIQEQKSSNDESRVFEEVGETIESVDKEEQKTSLSDRTALQKNFEDVFNSLEEDIKEKRITQLKTKQGFVSVEGSASLKNKENLKILYEDFVSQNIYDLSSFNSNELNRRIANLTNGKVQSLNIGIIWPVLQELLRRSNAEGKDLPLLPNKNSFDVAYNYMIQDLKESQCQLSFERPRSQAFKVSVGNDSILRIDGIPIKKEMVKSFYEHTNTNNWYRKHCELIINYMHEHHHLDLLPNSDNVESGQYVYSDNMNMREWDKPFVFIIDEINRGEISKIFGELFFSIDPGYRGEKGRVQTQYQNMVEEGDVFKDGFYVPENVYIIGTMNDIDRSVESMDFAMRRRFAWAEVTAKESYMNMIENDAEMVEVKDEIKQRMSSLNNAILNKKLGLGEAYQIGAAYFRKVLNYTQEGYGQEEAFQMLWDNHLKGLLFEYLRGNQNAKEQLEMLHQAYEKHDAQHEGQQGEGTDD